MAGHVQDVNRALVLPPLSPDADQDLQNFVRNYIVALSNQLQFLHSSFEAQEVAIANGLGNIVVTWQTPADDPGYTAFALPSWSTTVYFSNRLQASIQMNFGTVAPGAQTLFVCRVR